MQKALAAWLKELKKFGPSRNSLGRRLFCSGPTNENPTTSVNLPGLPTRASSTAQPLLAQWELIRSAENHQAISLTRDASFYHMYNTEYIELCTYRVLF